MANHPDLYSFNEWVFPPLKFLLAWYLDNQENLIIRVSNVFSANIIQRTKMVFVKVLGSYSPFTVTRVIVRCQSCLSFYQVSNHFRYKTMGETHFCAITYCHSKSGDKGSFERTVQLHRHPKEGTVRSVWLRAIIRKDFKPTTYASVCSFSDMRRTHNLSSSAKSFPLTKSSHILALLDVRNNT